MIPRSKMESQAGSPASQDWKMPVRQTRPRPRVWLVDASDELRNLLAVMLASEGGFDCEREFPSPRAVLAALAEETPPDLILLDVQMGAECGLDAIEPIKRLAGSTHVVMLTPCFDSRYQARARQSGATDFLLKSYSLEQIAARIWQALERPVPVAESGVEVLANWEAPSVTKSGSSVFTHHDWSGRWFAGWKPAWSRILRGAFLVRSRLAMFF